MADLSDTQSSQSVKIVGSSSDGSETTPIGNTGNRLKVESNFPQNDYLSSSFGGLRVVETENIFESLFSFDKQPLIWDEVLTLGGTSTFNANTNSVDMTLPTTSGASIVRQTFRRMRYNPSRTVQALVAGTLGAPKANVRKRMGQFDSLDGVFFEHDGLTVNLVRRSSTSGSAVDSKIPQSSWSIDKFDGTGASGITIDFSKHQLFFIHYAFQGAGDMVFGLYSQGRILYAHRESVANTLTTSWARTAHLPCRVEITNTGVSASSTTMSYNSFTVKNEGGDADQEGQVRSYSSAPEKTVTTVSTPVLSLRLGAGFERAVAEIIKTSIYVNTSDEVIWGLFLNPTLTGATFAVSSSYIAIDTAATLMTGGTELVSGILGQTQESSEISASLLRLTNSLLGSSINGTNSIITLAARSRVVSADVLSALVWKEYP